MLITMRFGYKCFLKMDTNEHPYQTVRKKEQRIV